MHNKFIELDSMFSRKILKEGINLIWEISQKSG
jgi:hypothetical protein